MAPITASWWGNKNNTSINPKTPSTPCLTPKIPSVFFYQFLQFLTYLEESISLPKKVWELEEVTIGSWSYLVEHQPPKITAPHSMGSRRL
jgi:hypothetical protein